MRDVRRMSETEQARLAAQRLTYEPVGLTRDGTWPPGFHRLDVGYVIGHGDATFYRAAEALMTWRMHLGAGLRVTAPSDRIVEGGVVRANLGPLPIPCRVVWVVDEPDARGFGYGTLPGHPEAGEEAFVVRRVGDTVRVDVRAYSRPGILLTRVAGPLGRLAQRIAIGRYAAALRRAGRSSRGTSAAG